MNGLLIVLAIAYALGSHVEKILGLISSSTQHGSLDYRRKIVLFSDKIRRKVGRLIKVVCVNFICVIAAMYQMYKNNTTLHFLGRN